MTTKWLVSIPLALVLAGCGGGGGDAAPERALTAGLTLEQGTGAAAVANGSYNVRMLDYALQPGVEYFGDTVQSTSSRSLSTIYAADNTTTAHLNQTVEVWLSVDNSYSVKRVILMDWGNGLQQPPRNQMGCGVEFSLPCSGITVDAAKGTITMRNLQLRSVTADTSTNPIGWKVDGDNRINAFGIVSTVPGAVITGL